MIFDAYERPMRRAVGFIPQMVHDPSQHATDAVSAQTVEIDNEEVETSKTNELNT